MDNEDQPTPLSRSQSINNTDLGLFEGLELGKGKISNDGTIELNEKKMAVL